MLSTFFLLLSILLTILNPAVLRTARVPLPARDLPASKARVMKSYAALPMSFEVNEGQAAGAVRFLARGRGYTILLEPGEAELALAAPDKNARFPEKLRNQQPPSTRFLRMKIEGANPEARATGLEKLPGVSNYFIGNDPRQWRTHIATYKKVQFDNVRPGVNLVYYGNQGELEYDFTLSAGIDPRSLELSFEGGSATLSKQGDLVFPSTDGEVTFHRPVAYQRSRSNPAEKRLVAASYVLKGAHRVGFEVSGYDPSEPLVIDPYLYYSTYLGGNGGDTGNAIAMDSLGDAFVTGSTTSTNFPTKGDPVAYKGTYQGNTDAFVTMVRYDGEALVYSTYLGGNNYDVGNGIGVDTSGDVYIAGTTMSTNFPTTANVFQPSFGGNTDAFVAKLDPTGSKLLYGSYLGGSDVDYGLAMALDQYGNVFVTGYTESTNFPTVNPVQSGNNGNGDAFVAEVNTQATELVYSTYLGGSGADSGQGIAVDLGDNAYVTGYTFSTNFPVYYPYQSANAGSVDAFIAKLTAGGSSFAFSTYFGGTGDDRAWAIALDSELNLYITGTTLTACTPTTTTSTLCNPISTFPTTPGAFETYTTKQSPGYSAGFISKFNFTGANLLYSTLLGGSLSDVPTGIAIDSAFNAYVTGHTNSVDFPTANALQGSFTGGSCGVSPCPNAFVTEMNAAASSPVYSTYLGGNNGDFGNGIALYPNPNNNNDVEAFVVGTTDSLNFPTIALAYQGQSGNVTGLGNAFVSSIYHNNLAGVALTPQSLAFGNVIENTVSTVTSLNQPAVVTLMNAGTAPLQVSSVGVTGDFTETDNCVGTIPAGGGLCEISIKFAPTGLAAETEQLIIKDNAAGSPQYVTLTGTGITGNATVLWTPNSLVFGTYTINQTSPTQTVTMTNNGQSALTVTNITASGDFAETTNCPSTPFTLPIQGSCVFQVSFTPTSTGVRKGSLNVTDNTTAGTSAISLTGTGNPIYQLSSPSVSQTVPIGVTSTTALITLTAPSTFTDTITLNCSSGTCSFNPTAIALNNTTLPSSATVTLKGLSPSSSNPSIFTISGIDSTTGVQTATLSLSVYFQDFTISASPAVQTVQAGAATIYQVTVSPINGFNQPVLIGCVKSTLPGESTCLANPASLAPNGGAVSALLSISTTAQSTTTTRLAPLAHPSAPPPPPKMLLALWAGSSLLMLAFLVVRDRMRSRDRARPRTLLYAKLALAMLALTAALWVSCDTGIYTNVIQPNGIIGTPTGNYAITVAGQFIGSTTVNNGQITGSTTTVTRSTGIDLTVQ
jgi:hypothetical protein